MMKRLFSWFFVLLLCGFATQEGSAKKRIKDKKMQAAIYAGKQFKTERITVKADSIQIDYCINESCSHFISWMFSLKEIGQIQLLQEEGNFFIRFDCLAADCVRPPMGTIYSPKKNYDLYVTDKEQGIKLLRLLLKYKKQF